MKHRLLYFFLLPLIFSCSRDIVYFSDLDEDQTIYTEKVKTQPTEPVIQPGDLLSITVNSLNVEANVPFNKGTLRTETSPENITTVGVDEGYLVDNLGNIEFPILGTFKVGGLSKSEIKERLTARLVEYLKEPLVNIRYLNYRITVVGEVNDPSTFLVPSERINIIEALGLAGDMTVYGSRDNVLIIKESDGQREIVRLNLNNKEVLNSPYFYLQPNDVVYVEPVKTKKAQASLTRSNISLLLSAMSAVTLILIYSNR